MAWFEVFPTREREREVTQHKMYVHSNSNTRPILGGTPTLQRHDSVNVLTSSRPPFDGADGGTVQDKLLCGWVICGCGFQPSKVSA